MDVTLPDGVVISGVPEGTTQTELLGRLQLAKHPSAGALMKQMASQQTLGDMGPLDKFNAGMGLAFTNLGRAGKQMFGMGSDYQENKDTDRALTSTGAGMAGNIAGNVAAFAPAALVPGANSIAGAVALGSVMGAFQPSDSTAERFGNMGKAALLNAGIQGVSQYPNQIYEAAKTAVKKPFQIAQAAAEPLYESGRDKILSRALTEATGGGRQQVIDNLKNARELVPGSLPTAAEAAGSGGIAAMQRSAAAVDPEAYAVRAAQQNEARVGALDEMSGTGGQRAFFDADRRTAANALYEKAYEKGVDIRRNPETGQFLPKSEIAGVKGEITKLTQRPAIQEAMERARTLAANEGVKLTDPSGSIKGLDYVKRALDDQIKTSQGNEQRILVDLKNRLLTTLDRLSPDYAQARLTFTEMSKPINRMDIAQEISDKAINKLTGALQPQAYARALSDNTAARATGFGKATLENIMEPQQLGVLNNIKEDLARSVAARDIGRGPGSDTVQKLAMTNLMQRAGLPLGVLNTPGVGRVGNWLYQNADEQMRKRLAQALLDPKETAALLEKVKPYIPMGSPSQLTKDNAAMLGRALLLPSAAASQ